MRQTETGENEIVIFIGTHKLVALEGSVEGGDPRILRIAVQKNPEGFEKGFVTHLEKAATSLEMLIKQLLPERSPAAQGLPCYVVLGNGKLKTFTFSSSQYFQGMQRTITSQEVRQIVDQTRSVATLPLSEYVLQAIPESFMVNDMEGVTSPLGLEAHRLGVWLKIHSMHFQDFKNISRAFEIAEIEVEGYFPRTLTVSEAVLTEQEKNDGALLMDIADDSTYLTLWKSGKLIDTLVLETGSRHITEQIAAEWSIDFHDAQKVKEKYASLELESFFADELIPLVDRGAGPNPQIHRQAFQEKFLEHAYSWIEAILSRAEAFAHEHKMAYPYYVFTGGATALDGFLEFLQKKFSRTGRMGITRKIEAASELLVDPSLPGALGMFRLIGTSVREQERLFAHQGFFQRTIASARDWFFATF